MADVGPGRTAALPDFGPDLCQGRSVTDRILDCIEQIPPGRVLTYGDVAELAGLGAARTVGMVLARDGAQVPWHRVLRADGSCAEHIRSEQLALLRAEGVPMRRDRIDRIDLAQARWDGLPPVTPRPTRLLS